MHEIDSFKLSFGLEAFFLPDFYQIIYTALTSKEGGKQNKN